MLTHWKKLENPEYIGSYAFQPDERKIVTIKSVRREMVSGADGKREECTVVHFAEAEKPLILNATNGKAIAKVAKTPYIEQWAGVRIELHVEKVKAFGEIVEAVRVGKDPGQVKREEPAMTCADCGKTITAYESMTPAAVSASTKKRFGVALCIACGQKRAEKEKQRITEGGEAD